MVKMTQNHKLLIIEDSLGDARLVQETLKDTDFRDCKTTLVDNLDQLDQHKKSRFQAILLDLHLSDIKPLDTFRLINGLYPTTPIIVLTGLDDDNLAARIVREGAQDYLVKGTYDSDNLQRSLKYSIYRKKAEQRIAKQKQASKRLKTRADNFEGETKRLESINKTKDVFLSIASHQLRTPATAVKQYIGMVLNGFAGDLLPAQRNYLETAYQSNERQLKIVDDLLKVARIDGGYVTLHKEPINIIALIRNVIEDVSGLAETKKQKIFLETKVPEVVTHADANNIRMVFENLIDNAIKYSAEKTKIKVAVSTTDNWVNCQFIDSGIGISADDQKKLFQKFSRIDDAFNHATNGSGLGLYWAREIVKLHNGEIDLESTKGKGSKFQVKLPVMQTV
ncbi:MAG: hypothetical protein NVS1B10_02470 [Candidatus Saccharimonadales bacterium]